MNHRALLATLALVAAAACGPGGPQPPVAVNHVHPSATPATAPAASPATSPTPGTAAPASSPAALDRCHTGGLLISFSGSQGAAGTIYDTFRVANTRTYPCTLYGYVGMLMLDSGGQPLPTQVVRTTGPPSGPAGPSSFVLQPGTAGTFTASWSDVPHGSETTCPAAAQLEITPPDEFDHVVIPVKSWSLAPCGHGQINVTPIRAANASPA